MVVTKRVHILRYTGYVCVTFLLPPSIKWLVLISAHYKNKNLRFWIIWGGTSYPFSYLDNTISYNLRMAFNCWSQFKGNQPGLNNVRFPDQIIMLHCLSLFYEAAWWIEWSSCVWSCFYLLCFTYYLKHYRTSRNSS